MEAEILLKIKAAEVALPESLRVPDDLDHLSAADVKIWLTAATGHLLKEIRLRKAQAEIALRLEAAQTEAAAAELKGWRNIASVQAELRVLGEVKKSGAFCPPLKGKPPVEPVDIPQEPEKIISVVTVSAAPTKNEVDLLPRKPNLQDYNFSEDLTRDLLSVTGKTRLWPNCLAEPTPFDNSSFVVTPGLFDGRLPPEITPLPQSGNRDVSKSLLAFRKGEFNHSDAVSCDSRIGGLKNSTGSMNGSLIEDPTEEFPGENDTLVQLFPRGKVPSPDFNSDDTTATVPIVIPSHIVPLPSTMSQFKSFSGGTNPLDILSMKPKPPTLLLADKKELSATLPPPSKPIGFGMDGEFKRPMTSGLNPVKSAKKNSILPPPPTSLLNDSGVNNDLNVTYVVGANEKLGSSLKRLRQISLDDYNSLDFQTKSVLSLESINDAIRILNGRADSKDQNNMAFSRSDLPKILCHFNGVQILSFIKALSHSGRLRSVRPSLAPLANCSAADQTVFLSAEN